MESLVYYFGKDRDNYYQYPTDYTEDFFQKELINARNKAQIAIHRDGNLLFYSYIRQLDNKESKLGISIATDFIVLDFQDLFESLETFYSILAESGTIIKFADNGDVIINPHPFSDEKVYLEELSKEIKAYIADIPKNKKRKLPIQDFSVSKDDCKELSLEDGNTEIALALESYSNVYISTTRLEIEKVTSWGSQIREKTERIQQLESENEKLKKNPIGENKRKNEALLIVSILLLIVAGFHFFKASKLAAENDMINEELIEIKDSLNTVINFAGKLDKQNDSLSKVVSNIKNFKFSVGSNRRPSSPNGDKSWVEWIEVKMPLKIESFYTWASSTGKATIAAYNTMRQKVAETRVSVNGGTWQEVKLKNFNLKSVGRYFLCVEDTSVDFAYVSSNDDDYALYKKGPLQIIGATSRNTADEDNPSIKTGYYQYFFSIQYSLF